MIRKVVTKFSSVLQFQVNAEAKYDDESISVRNSEASYGLFAGKLRRFVFGSSSDFDLRSKITLL